MNNCMHFDQLGEGYSSFVATDPIRNELHYPTVLSIAREVDAKIILDMGCGDGALARQLAAECAARVIAFDISPALVEIALSAERDSASNISYFVADCANFKCAEKVELVTSVMVLPYSTNAASLSNFFACAKESLMDGGRFAAILFNPDFDEYGQILANRRFSKLEAGVVKVEFLDRITKTALFESQLYQHSRAIYDKAANDSGFQITSWSGLFPQASIMPDARTDPFWRDCIQAQPYAFLLCQ
jgi:cyclopropane fatty-acyl-phospholipid synthase-like methyltransferase